MWYIIGLIDTIIKGLEYGAILLIPLLIAIIIISKKKINNYKLIRKVILIVIVLLLLTSRIWGPTFFKYQIGLIIENQSSSIEKQLEDKYKKNFTFVSKGKTQLTDEFAGSVLGQVIIYDYEVIYTFKDDDGVPAIVRYKLGEGWDYYQLRRAEYDIEQTIYNYAKVNNINDEFYVKCVNYYELIKYNRLSDLADDNYMNKEMDDSKIIFVSPHNTSAAQIISTALYNRYPTYKKISVSEYLVTDVEYQRFKNYYNNDYSYTIHEDNDFRFNEGNVLYKKYR